jgi:hypothetical protein
VSVFVHRAAQFRADDLALAIRQRDGRLEPDLGNQFAMQDGSRRATRISRHFTLREADRLEMKT